jgi:hypothetical protein
MSIPYRTRSALKRFFTGALIFLAVAALLFIIWLLWLGRFVVYTRDGGVKLDFDRPATNLSGELAQKPIIENPISIYYNEGDNQISTSTEMTRISGYYVSGAELEDDLSGILAQIRQLPKGAAVMVDVKSAYGNFFYSSTVSQHRNPDLDTEAMDAFIKEINKLGYYTIARVPALRDKNFGLANTSCGLAEAGGWLWEDRGFYWLDPTKEGTVSFLAQIALEVRELGFNEVMFYDYYFPDSGGRIVFNGDKQKALEETARTLVKTCATDQFAVSFTQSVSFKLPEGRSRLYLENIAATDAGRVAAQTGFENPDVKAVFITQVHDTRFDPYSVLRPISMVY